MAVRGPLAAAILAAAVSGAAFPGPASGPVPPPFTCPPSRAQRSEVRPSVGVNMHAFAPTYSDPDRCRVFGMLAAAGVGWLRLDLGWLFVQPLDPAVAGGIPESLDPSFLALADHVVDAARAQGLEVLMSLLGTPPWANGGRLANVPPEDPADLGRIAGWLAGHFRGRVAAWQVWNEPNSATFLDAGALAGVDLQAGAYLELLRAAAPAIRRADPRATVVLGGPVFNDVDWLRALYRLGGRGLFDVLSTQPYMVPACLPPETRNATPYTLASVRRVRHLMDREGDGSVPIWFTEFGWSSHANAGGESPAQLGVSREQQAAYLVGALGFLAEAEPTVERVFWYEDRDEPASTDPREANFGLLDRSLAPKPAYEALQNYLLHGEGLILNFPEPPCPPG